jgi:hypothetical protein
MADVTDADLCIDLSSDVTDFFRTVVDEALREEQIEATEAAESYVVGLLADYAKPVQRTDETLCRPMTLLLAEAMQSTGSERFERLRCLGDGVLYVSGFFADHLRRRGVAREYVATLGASAYHGAASTLRRSATLSGTDASGVPDLFVELADNFSRFARLLSRVADALAANSAHSDRAALRLYERWLQSGSCALAEALMARGMLPQRGDRTLH